MAILVEYMSCDILVVAVVFVCLCDAQPWGPSSQKPAVARGPAMQCRGQCCVETVCGHTAT